MNRSELSLSPDSEYVVRELLPELEERFRGWSQEYQQERDLGALGEFVGLYRKARKLKTVFIDKVDPAFWREPVRTIALEVAAHALLLVRDLDHDKDASHNKWTASKKAVLPNGWAPNPVIGTVVFDSDRGKFFRLAQNGCWTVTCGPECAEAHTYSKTCAMVQVQGGTKENGLPGEQADDDPEASF